MSATPPPRASTDVLARVLGSAGADRHPRRIVCLTEESVEILYRIGAGDRVVGVSKYVERPPEARSKPRVCAFVKADFGKIEALEPDLVLCFSDLQAEIAAECARRGLSVVLFNQRSVAEILGVVPAIGALVGREAAAKALVEELEGHLRAVAAKADALSRRPRVHFEEWDDPLITGIRWVAELVEVAGGAYLFPERAAGKAAGERIVDPAEVVRRDPEVILASWCGKAVDAKAIAARAGWAGTSAVRAGRIHEIAPSLILQPGPAALADGVDALHAAISAAARG